MKKENKMQGNRKLALIVLSGLLLPIFGLSAGTVENEVNAIKIVPGQQTLRLEIGTVGNVTVDAFTMSEPDRVVIDCVGAKYDINWSEKECNSPLVYRIRTSQFEIEPVPISRIVLDLKGPVDYRLWEEGDVRIVELTRRGADRPVDEVSAVTDIPAAPTVQREETERDPASEMPKTLTASMGPVLPLVTPLDKKQEAVRPAELEKDTEERQKAYTPWIEDARQEIDLEAADEPVAYETGSAQRALQVAQGAAWSDAYMRGAPAGGGGFGMGSRRITLDAQGADIKTVLRTISDFAGVNIVAGDGVKADVFVHIKDAPWDEALDVLLKAYGFGYREEFGMIRVCEMQKLRKEELDQQAAERKKEDLFPLVTRIIFIHNSNAEELKNALQNVVTTRGQIDVDNGSNALVVNDIENNLDKIEAMVRDLDKKNHQVDINAKLVEVDVEATRELGIDWGLLNLHKSGFSGVGGAEVNAGIPLSAGSVKFGTVRSWGELNAILQMLERANKANIISNPRITTMDNREASILVGKEIPLIVADEAGNPITELTKIGIMLRVIPHVNSDKTITLDLHPEVSELQSEATAQGGVIISTNEADTRVIVRNGETAVIGGLIKKVESEVRTGIPYLKDVPLLGYLFSSSSIANKKQELVIFVTPTIVE